MVFAATADAVLVIKRGGIKMGMKENAFAYIDAHRSEMLKAKPALWSFPTQATHW